MRSLVDRVLGHRLPVDEAPTSAAVHPDAHGWAAPGRADSATGAAAVLLCHGFTGSPYSMTPWATHLNEQGYGVEVPRLPGHGTSWQDLNRVRWTDWYDCVEQRLTALAARYETVFVAALSMGGALALRLAARHPRLVAGLALVNPAIASRDPRLALTPLVRHVLPSIPAIGDDIALAGVSEAAYPRTPIGGVAEMTFLQAATRAELPQVTAPVLMFRSIVDHVVDSSSAELILRQVAADRVSERLLYNSFHVATLDHDAADIFAESAAFFAGLLPGASRT